MRQVKTYDEDQELERPGRSSPTKDAKTRNTNETNAIFIHWMETVRLSVCD